MKKLPALLALTLLHCVALAQTTTPKTTYILAGRLFDATDDKVRENVLITIEGDRIKSVAAATQPPQGATVIDLSHATVLPGLHRLPHAPQRASRPLRPNQSL
jgi:cytosine/adenosine deaminase-related metal-dependent hydrolase